MSKPPLWKVVDEAWWSLVNTEDPHCDPPAGDQAACVILALRDWLFPEDWVRPSDPADRVRWRRDLELRALLTAEADRAERGESTNG